MISMLALSLGATRERFIRALSISVRTHSATFPVRLTMEHSAQLGQLAQDKDDLGTVSTYPCQKRSKIIFIRR
jgi:hypothetical protein